MQTTNAKQRYWYGAPLLLVLLGVGGLVTIVYLFALRFGVGDIYPQYSSLRADRIGTKVLNESLASAGYDVSRNYHKLNKLKVEPANTVLFIGLPGFDSSFMFNNENYDQLLRLPQEGARLVVTIMPQRKGKREDDLNEEETKDSLEPVDENNVESSEEQSSEEQGAQDHKDKSILDDILQLSTEHFVTIGDKESQFQSIAYGEFDNASLEIPWYSTLYFTELTPEWRVILKVRGQPVLIERMLLKGSLVVATDSHFLSNEALWHDRDPYFLTWLMGGNKTVVFDEMHHGIKHQVSVGRLIRDFNLHWVLIGLMVPALLFVYRCSMPLLPPVSGLRIKGASRAGRDQFSGLINILRSHSPDNLLQVCASLWCKSNQSWCEKHPMQVEEIEKIAQTGSSRGLVEKYKKISRLVQGRHKQVR